MAAPGGTPGLRCSNELSLISLGELRCRDTRDSFMLAPGCGRIRPRTVWARPGEEQESPARALTAPSCWALLPVNPSASGGTDSLHALDAAHVHLSQDSAEPPEPSSAEGPSQRRHAAHPSGAAPRTSAQCRGRAQIVPNLSFKAKRLGNPGSRQHPPHPLQNARTVPGPGLPEHGAAAAKEEASSPGPRHASTGG